jgi:hypothetical protein
MIRDSIIYGVTTIGQSKRLVVWYYIWNLVFGILITLPFFIMLNGKFSESLLSHSLAKQFDIRVLFELLKNQNSFLPMLITFAVVFLLINGVIKLWFSGGAFSYFTYPKTFSLHAFIKNSSHFIRPFLRLSLWFVPMCIAVFSIVIAYSLLIKIVIGNEPSELVSFWNNIIKLVLFVKCSLFCGMIFDYARLYIVYEDTTHIRSAVLHGLIFVMRHFIRTTGLLFTLVILGLGVLVMFFGLSLALAGFQWWIILLIFLVQQCYLFLRQFLQLMAIGSQAYLFKTLHNEGIMRKSLYGRMKISD